MAYTINVHGAGQSLPHAVPHVAGVQPDGLVDDLQPDAVAVLPLRLTLEGDVLLLPPEHIVLEKSYTHLIILYKEQICVESHGQNRDCTLL